MLSSPVEKELSREDQLDAVFHALADRTRRALIARLANGPTVITELAQPFNMTLAAVSKHLRVLESAKLIKREVDGRFHRCKLSARPMLEADRWLQEYTEFWEDTLDSLTQFISDQEANKNP